MNLKWKLTRAFFLSLAAAIAFGLTALLISGNAISRFDSSIISYIQGLETPSLTVLMKFFTWVGSGPVVAVLALIAMLFLFIVLKHRSELILFVAVVAGSAVLNEILKNLFHRARPSLHRLIEVSGFSFPSGHSMEAFALYGILAFLLWRHIPTRIGRGMLILISAVMILLIGGSRIYLGVHYPSDIIGGYLASGFWLAAAIWVYQQYQERRN